MFKKSTTLKKKAKQLFSTLLAAGMLSITAQAATADTLFVGSAVNEYDQNGLVFFSSDNPSKATLMQIQGLRTGERLRCLDVRPANGQLYTVTTRDILYTLNISGKVAKANRVAPLDQPLMADSCGCGFNPAADRLRIVCDSNLNYSVNPDTAVVTVQTPVSYGALKFTDGTYEPNAGQDPGIAGVDYTNNDNDPATGTMLFDIDTTRDILVMQNIVAPAPSSTQPPLGQLATVGSLGVKTTGSLVVGFDIQTLGSNYNVGYAALQTTGDSRSRLYQVNLGTGAATFMGKIGGPKPLQSLAILP